MALEYFNVKQGLTTGSLTFAESNVTLGNVANLHISGGSSGQFLKTNGAGVLSFDEPVSSPAPMPTVVYTGETLTIPIENQTITMVPGTPTYNLAASDIDVIQSICRMPTGQGTASQADLTMDRVSREYYNNIPNKLTTGQPTQYYIDRQITPVLYVWPAPDNNYEVIVTKLIIVTGKQIGRAHV